MYPHRLARAVDEFLGVPSGTRFAWPCTTGPRPDGIRSLLRGVTRQWVLALTSEQAVLIRSSMIRQRTLREPVRRFALSDAVFHEPGGEPRAWRAQFALEVGGARYWLQNSDRVDVAYEVRRLLPGP